VVQKSGESQVEPTVEAHLTTTAAPSPDIWHKRLCHLNPQAMTKMAPVVEGLTLPSGDISKSVGIEGACSSCIVGKMTAKPYKSTGHTVSAPQRVHADVIGPVTPESIDGEKYVLTIIDEFSDFSAGVLLKSKADASKELVTVITQWETQIGCLLKALRTDQGTEFNGVDSFCRKRGAVHQRTAPYAHQQNVKVERLNRTLQEKARCILAESELELDF
jgi:transposase InsO family protein